MISVEQIIMFLQYYKPASITNAYLFKPWNSASHDSTLFLLESEIKHSLNDNTAARQIW